MKIGVILGILVTVLALGGAADAGTVGAGPLQSVRFQCNVVNFGPGVIHTVTIEIVNSGTGELLETETCVALAPNRECVAFHDAFPDATRAFCRVESTGKASQIRGNLRVDDLVLPLQ